MDRTKSTVASNRPWPAALLHKTGNGLLQVQVSCQKSLSDAAGGLKLPRTHGKAQGTDRLRQLSVVENAERSRPQHS